MGSRRSYNRHSYCCRSYRCRSYSLSPWDRSEDPSERDFFGRMSDLWRNPDPTRPKKIRKFSLFQGCIPSHCNVNFQLTLLIKKCVFPKKKKKKKTRILDIQYSGPK